MTESLRVRYVSFDDNGGYGTAARRAMRGLVDAGVRVMWSPVRWFPEGVAPAPDLDGVAPWLADLADPGGDADVALVHLPPQHWPTWRESLGRIPFVGLPVWETTVLPPAWIDWMAIADHVIVPSEWNADVWASAGLDRPSVVPYCAAAPLSAPPETRPDGITTFLTTGDWTSRKAVDSTIEAYLRAFTGDDPVRLIVKTGTVDCTGRPPLGGGPLELTTTWAITRLLARQQRPPRVEVITRDLVREEMRALWDSSDCFVSLAHGEGFGLGSFDAATHGRPVIITGWSAPEEVLGDDAYLVDHTLVPVDDPLGAQGRHVGQEWAQPSLDHAVDLLRSVVEHRDDALGRGERLAVRIQQQFGSAVVTRRLVDVLDVVVAAHG